MIITQEQPTHAAVIEQILLQSFGPDRFHKTVYRLREGVAPLADLGLVALRGGRVAATIRYWPVMVGDSLTTLLLGPIAVAEPLRGLGLGRSLITQSLDIARARGYRSVLLVGDAPYYTRFGFARTLTTSMSLPGPVNLARFLGLELVPGALQGATGMLKRCPKPWPASWTEEEVLSA